MKYRWNNLFNAKSSLCSSWNHIWGEEVSRKPNYFLLINPPPTFFNLFFIVSIVWSSSLCCKNTSLTSSFDLQLLKSKCIKISMTRDIINLLDLIVGTYPTQTMAFLSLGTTKTYAFDPRPTLAENQKMVFPAPPNHPSSYQNIRLQMNLRNRHAPNRSPFSIHCL